MQEYFWSISIEEAAIAAAIWTTEENAAKVVCFSTSVIFEDDETLITAADEALSSCVQKLPENIEEPTRSVFGVPSYWVADGQIQRQYLDKIRLICNKLSLTPTGFVVMPEAVSYFEKTQEKTPISAILIGVYPQSVDVSLFRLGNMVGNVNVARSLSVSEDVIEGIARFESTEMLPSRFLLYMAKTNDLEEIKQELIKTDWDSVSDKVKFLHTPQVEILTEETKMAAVSLAGAVETSNVTVAKVSVNEEKKETEMVPDNFSSLEEGVVDAATLGFVMGKDLPDTPETPIHHAPSVKIPVLPKFKFRRFGIPKFNGNGFLKENFIYIAVVLIFFILVGSFVAYWFVPHAAVTIFVTPTKLEADKQIKFDPNATGVDLSKLIVPIKKVTTTVSGSKTKTTTGTKTIGNPAKGSVTFYNVGGSVDIPAGTILSGSSLNFSLDQDIQLASASGAASAATAKGNITASGVGADYNLAANTFFSITGFSSSLIQAKNEADLTNGSSQEVTAVSKDDVDSLTKSVTDELASSGRDNLKSELTGGNLLSENGVTTTVTAKTLDHQIGVEATTLKLSETATVTGFTYARSDMNSIAAQVFAGKIPSGFSLKDDQIDFVTNNTQTHFIVNLLPSIDTVKTANQIAGKSFSDARNILSKLPGFTDLNIIMKPNISILSFLPHVAHNISITLSGK